MYNKNDVKEIFDGYNDCTFGEKFDFVEQIYENHLLPPSNDYFQLKTEIDGRKKLILLSRILDDLKEKLANMFTKDSNFYGTPCTTEKLF